MGLNSKKIVEEYLKQLDWRVKENSNSPFSFGGLNKHICAEVTKDYWLRHVYPENVAMAYINGDMHIHDLSGLTLYCCGYSLRDILEKGVQGVPNIPTSSPAKHFDAILNQISNLITVFQNEIMGAVALNSFDTLLAPFIKSDKLEYQEVYQSLQNFIFSINSNSRGGAEPAFSNLTFDITPPDDLLDDYVFVGGDYLDFTYKECQSEIDMINKAFYELMLKGDARGRPFAYPIPTYNIHNRFDWENSLNDPLFEMAGKYGYPYFANFLNSDMNPSDIRSMCVLPDTLVQIRVNGKKKIVTIKTMFDKYDVNDIQMLTRLGYKNISEKMEFHYVGDMYKFTTESGKVLVTTPDHPHIVVGRDKVKERRNSYNKILASEVKVGDYYVIQSDRTIDKYDADEQKIGSDCNSCKAHLSLQAKEVNAKLGESGKYVSENRRVAISKSISRNPNIITKTMTSIKDKIVSIEIIPYDGNVYDIEIADSNSEIIDPMLTHTFYANGILTGNCCRLSLNLKELSKRNGGLFGSGDSTGSIGVVTVNLPRIAYKNKGNKSEFYKELDAILVLAKDSLEIKRNFIQENVIENNLIPAYNTYVGTIKNHFSTIGVLGMNEMCLNFFDGAKNILEEEGREFAIEVGNFIRNRLLDFQQETGNLYNFEATPAESTCYRLAKIDRKEYPEIITQGPKRAPYYTNSCHIPVNKVESIKHLFENQEDLQILFTGGTVIHVFLNMAIDKYKAKHIVKTICETYKVPYISLSPLNRYCEEHGYINTDTDTCPICGSKLDMYQRITGYLRKVEYFNEGKKSEFKDRKQLRI